MLKKSETRHKINLSSTWNFYQKCFFWSNNIHREIDQWNRRRFGTKWNVAVPYSVTPVKPIVCKWIYLSRGNVVKWHTNYSYIKFSFVFSWNCDFCPYCPNIDKSNYPEETELDTNLSLTLARTLTLSTGECILAISRPVVVTTPRLLILHIWIHQKIWGGIQSLDHKSIWDEKSQLHEIDAQITNMTEIGPAGNRSLTTYFSWKYRIDFVSY